MEQVLDLYQESYDPQFPLVCMDEKSKQLIADTRAPLPSRAGSVAREDHEYERNGTASIFMFAEPLSGFRQATAREQRTKVD